MKIAMNSRCSSEKENFSLVYSPFRSPFPLSLQNNQRCFDVIYRYFSYEELFKRETNETTCRYLNVHLLAFHFKGNNQIFIQAIELFSVKHESTCTLSRVDFRLKAWIMLDTFLIYHISPFNVANVCTLINSKHLYILLPALNCFALDQRC